MEYYIVYIPQQDNKTIITKDERDKYLERLKNYRPKLTIDYSDDNLPTYDLDREIDDWSVEEAKDALTNAKKVNVRLKNNGSFVNEAYKDYRENKWELDSWFEDFDDLAKTEGEVIELLMQYAAEKKGKK